MKMRDSRSDGLFRHRQSETAFTAAFGGPDSRSSPECNKAEWDRCAAGLAAPFTHY
jgi:hypothetical protein